MNHRDKKKGAPIKHRPTKKKNTGVYSIIFNVLFNVNFQPNHSKFPETHSLLLRISADAAVARTWNLFSHKDSDRARNIMNYPYWQRRREPTNFPLKL